MKILLVEDETKLARLIKHGLEQAGYTVDCLENGQEALDRLLLANDSYGLVILDRMLPGMDGLAVCHELRQQNVQVPIILLTALGNLDDRVAGLDMGADDYMVKPFAFSELLARIRTVLRRPTQALPAKLQVGNLMLDTAGRRAWANKRELALTHKEFALLELFMTHPGQVLDREQILSQLWDFAFDSFSNVVDVHIKNLRGKVDHGSTKPHFETIRGVGYKLVG